MHTQYPETSAAPLEVRPRRGVNLFWRTFFFLSLLLFGSIVAWLHTFRTLESGPRAVQTANQLASLVSLSRSALRYSDSIARTALVKTLADEEHVRIMPREPKDTFQPFVSDEFGERIAEELTNRLGSGTVVAGSVNGKKGLWIGFSIEGDSYWLQTDPSRFGPPRSSTWAIWLMTAAALSLAGAAVIARVINQPLKKLSLAATRMREGDFTVSLLDEQVATSEIREVNMGFNRMAAQLTKVSRGEFSFAVVPSPILSRDEWESLWTNSGPVRLFFRLQAQSTKGQVCFGFTFEHVLSKHNLEPVILSVQEVASFTPPELVIKMQRLTRWKLLVDQHGFQVIRTHTGFLDGLEVNNPSLDALTVAKQFLDEVCSQVLK